SCLTENLEAVAEADDRTTLCRVRRDFLHHRAESGNRAGPKIVSVAEAARKDDDVRSLEVVVLVPQVDRFLADAVDDRMVRVVVAVRAGKRDDAEFHCAFTLAISKSSVIGFARSFWHMARTL